jgi:Tol biopolymer transport system component
MRSRALLAVLLGTVLLVPASPPAGASGPLVLVSGRESGALSLVKVYGNRAVVEPLVERPQDGPLYPVQGLGHSLTYVVDTGADAPDVGVLDVDTGRLRPVSRDHRSVELLVSPDGRHHYVGTLHDGYRVAISRTDARGRHRRTLFSLADADDADGMSRPALSPDGRTLYLGTSYSTSLLKATPALWAVDTATGRAKSLLLDGADGAVLGVAASPDGTMLAVSLVASLQYTVALVPVKGGQVRYLDAAGRGGIVATAFTPDSRRVVLTVVNRSPVNDTPVEYGLALADTLTGQVVPILGSEHLRDAVPVSPREMFPAS